MHAASASGAQPVVDLLPTLARADVCMSQGSCWPRATSAELHRSPDGDAAAVEVPIRVRTELYLRVPSAGRLRLGALMSGATLTVSVAGDGAEETTLYAGTSAADAHLDLTPWAGRTVRLRFRAEPIANGPRPAACTIRRLDLYGEDHSAAEDGVPTPPTRRTAPNVLVYLIDTVRADHLGCYGYPRPTTPRIDEFSRSALRFTDAVAQSSWTLSSTASLLTGLTPVRHGALADGVGIRADVPTAAAAFQAAGYRTAAFVTNYLASAEFGLGRGFDDFRLYDERPMKRRTVYLPSGALVRRVARWLGRPRTAPFFLYVHATDPHWPYLPPPRHLRPFHPAAYRDPAVGRAVNAAWPFFFGNARWGERRGAIAEDEMALLEALYDGDLRLADESFGALLDVLARSGVLADTIVVLTSDHGEEFQEHRGLAHGQTLYREVLHVPLLVRLPGSVGAGREIAWPVSHVDVLPTLLQAAGLPVPSGLDGRNLLRPRHPPEDEVYSFLTLMGAAVESVTAADWKVLHRLGTTKAAARRPFEAYERRRDPGERHDIAATVPVLVGYARQRFETRPVEPEPGPALDPKAVERLRALGYVQD